MKFFPKSELKEKIYKDLTIVEVLEKTDIRCGLLLLLLLLVNPIGNHNIQIRNNLLKIWLVLGENRNYLFPPLLCKPPPHLQF